MTQHRLTADWARRAALVLGSGLALWLTAPSPGEAAVEGRACEGEPTDQLIRYGDLINCAIDQIGDADVFRFSGGSGETVRLQIARLGGGRGCFQLFDPGGSFLDIPRCTNDSRDYLLNQTGTYNIVITENFLDETAQYALTLERIDPPSPTALPIDYDQIINDEINSIGDIDLFFFAAEAGDTVRLQISRRSGGRACFRAYAPDGAPLDIPRCTNDSRDYVIDQTGTYGVVMNENFLDETAQYAFTLVCVSGACPDLDLPAVSGCVARRGAPFSRRRVRLIQTGEPTRTTLTDVRGCYEFDRVVAGKTFQVRVASPRVPQPATPAATD